jgi:cytochrome c biogenesis protein
VPRARSVGTAILNQSDGVLLQELPFAVELKKFIVEYYSTGMPKLFASEIVIHDKETGEKIPAAVEVNHPASHRGIAIYQSSFDDGGSKRQAAALPLAAGGKPSRSKAPSAAAPLLITNGSDKLTLEYTGLRVINVENLAGDRPLGRRRAQGRPAPAR